MFQENMASCAAGAASACAPALPIAGAAAVTVRVCREGLGAFLDWVTCSRDCVRVVRVFSVCVAA